ncbi:MAG: glycosyltransferase family 39 protein [Candidatus Solibacter usitatus]|nr:glycosyltransferase family 39 protein [Candidatus Solibacter usitatus]
MNRAGFFLAVFLVLLAARFCHLDILWAEETLPMAAASQMEAGKTLYRDAWFDKPPLLADVYLLWGARTGWPLRLAGALYGLLVCGLLFVFARNLWSEREAYWAAGLAAFFLIFDFHAVVTPLAADLLMVAPHIAAVYLAFRGKALWSGAVAGVAFLVHTKGLFVLAACFIWSWQSWPLLLLGFAATNGIAAGWMASQGSLVAHIDQVWKWGWLYAGSTFLENPVRTGIERTAGWLGFHSALVIAAAWFWIRRESTLAWRFAAWAIISFAAVTLGWRFFPRYFFQLLPVLTLAAARGMVLLGAKRVIALAALLLPLIRFGPRYVTLARGDRRWADVAMDQDSRAAALLMRSASRPGDTLFVWGFRPEMFVYTGLPAGTRFLDCQPLTGVPADRHLTQSQPVDREFTAARRQEVAQSRPTFVVDGLSLLNPALAMDGYVELRPWLANYAPIGRTRTFVIYRLLAGPAGGTLPEKR